MLPSLTVELAEKVPVETKYAIKASWIININTPTGLSRVINLFSDIIWRDLIENKMLYMTASHTIYETIKKQSVGRTISHEWKLTEATSPINEESLCIKKDASILKKIKTHKKINLGFINHISQNYIL